MFNKEIDFQQDVINQFLQQKNPFFGTADSQFAGAAGAIGGIGGDLSGLAGQLQTSALASTAGASSAAAQQARVAAGGRGGLAFGGGAGQIASRAATNAAVGQSAALAQALVTGRTAEEQLNFQRTSTQASLASQLAQAFGRNQLGQAGLFEGRVNAQAGAAGNFQQIQAGLAGVQLGDRRAQSNATKALYGEAIGAVGSIIGPGSGLI